MERYENIVKIEEMRRLADNNQYEKAIKILDTMDTGKIKALTDLSIIADVYMQNGRYEEAMAFLTKIYNKTKTRRVLYQLVDLAIKRGNVPEAEDYLERYVKAAPQDSSRFIFRYCIDKLNGEPYEILIASLEQLKEYEYYEMWAYELAKLYHKAGMKDKCVRECGDIILWFGEGIYVEKAKLLKGYYVGDINPIHMLKAKEKREAEKKLGLDKTKDYSDMKSRIDQYLEEEESQKENQENEDLQGEASQPAKDPELEAFFKKVARKLEREIKTEEISAEPNILPEEEALTGQELSSEKENPAEQELLLKEEISPEEELLSGEEKWPEEKALSGEEKWSEEEALSEEENWPEEEALSEKEKWPEQEALSGKESLPEQELLSEKVSEQEPFKEYEPAAEEALLIDETAVVRERVSEEEYAAVQPEAGRNKRQQLPPETEYDGAGKENREQYEEAEEYKKNDLHSGNAAQTLYQAGKFDSVFSEAGMSFEKDFGYFIRMNSCREQIEACLETVLSDYTNIKHMIITGERKSGKTTLAKKFSKALSGLDRIHVTRVAKISAAKLNGISLVSQKDKLVNSSLIIEEAGILDINTAEQLLFLIRELEGNLFVVLEDKDKDMEELLKRSPKLREAFECTVRLPEYTKGDLLGFAFAYIQTYDYEFTLDVKKAFEKEIERIADSVQTEERLEAVMNLARKAKASADKRNKALLSDIIQARDLSSDDFLYMKKEDFLWEDSMNG